MHEPLIVDNSLPPQSAEEHLAYLVEHAARCHVIARGSDDDSGFVRSIVALGQEYAAQALFRGADPTSVPSPEQWGWLLDNLDRV